MKNAYEQKNVHMGGVDQFQMGTFTWADGWLMTLTSTSWAVSWPKLNYGQSGLSEPPGQYLSLGRQALFSNWDIANEDRRLICREVTGG